MKRYINIKNRIIPTAFVILVLFIWQLASFAKIIPSVILPSPINIISTLILDLPNMKEHIFVTCFEAIFGFLLAIIFAVLLAIIMDWFDTIKNAVYPIIIASQTIPIIVLAPLFMMWFGYGYLPKIIVVILVCFFPICINFFKALQLADKELINLLKSMGASKWQIYKYIKIPSSMPSFFSGLKIAGTYSVMGAVIGEWLGGMKGIGIYMVRVRQSFAIDKVFASIVVITVLSLIVIKIIEIIENSIIPWMKYINKKEETI